MNSEERNKALAKSSPEMRKRITAKLREYQSMRPEERESRLRATELSWYLQPLMRVAPTNRAALVERVPPGLRGDVESRLHEWDQLPAHSQVEILTNEVALRYFGGAERVVTPNTVTNMSPERLARLEAGIAQWRALPQDKRQETLDRFNHFIKLRLEEQKKALNKLSDQDRAQMEKTLRSYDDLSPEQREQCLRSFEKFAEMTLAERQQFLKNAERWKVMSPSERQAWTDLVRKTRPPGAETASSTANPR